MFNANLVNRIGGWCKSGAWIIAVVGFIQIVLGIFSTLQQNGQGGGLPVSLTITDILQGIFGIAAPTLFYFFVLYGAGMLMQALSDSILVNAPAAEKKEEPVIQKQTE